jgi:GR25 family glycosyltransferase involved in LPS biosynthesis
MDAYVINLKHRTDRWEQMVKNWSDKLNLIRVDGILMPPDDRRHVLRAVEGLGLTHMQLLKEAKEKGLKTILILEDDAVPEENWFERWMEIKAYLDTHLDEWEVFNGGIHFLRDYFGIKELGKSCLIDGKVACASHFIYLNLDAYDKFMSWPEKKEEMDVFYCYHHKMYCSYPLLSKQADGKSDIINDDRLWFMTYLQNEANFKYRLDKLYFKYNGRF